MTGASLNSTGDVTNTDPNDKTYIPSDDEGDSSDVYSVTRVKEYFTRHVPVFVATVPPSTLSYYTSRRSCQGQTPKESRSVEARGNAL